MTTNFQQPTEFQLRFVETTIATGKLDPQLANWQMHKWIKEVPQLANLKDLVKQEMELRRLAKG